MWEIPTQQKLSLRAFAFPIQLPLSLTVMAGSASASAVCLHFRKDGKED
jgi:hypothetical protein